MFKINRKLEYALMALKHMLGKKSGELTSAKEICQAYGAPFDATSRTLQIMVGHGLLKSEQGVRGGYLIIKNLAEVSFFDFVEMIEGSFQMTHCLHDDDGGCDIKAKCNIISPIMRLNEKLKDFCSSMSLLELLETTPAPQHRIMESIAV